MGAVFTDAPIEPRALPAQVAKIDFVAPCRYCGDGRRTTTNIRPVDSISRPMDDLNVCASQAERLIERAKAKGLDVSIRF